MKLLTDTIGCSSCDLYKNCSHPISTDCFGDNPKILFYMDRTTPESDLILEVGQERSEKNLIRILKEKFKSFALGYVLKCFNDLKGKTLSKAMEFCSNTWVEKEIEVICPKVVVALGELSYNTLVKKWTACSPSNSKFKNQIGKIYIRPDNKGVVGWYSANYILNHGAKTEFLFNKFLDNVKTVMESLNV